MYIPSTIEGLGYDCFRTMFPILKIYSAAKIPPVYVGMPDFTPFGRYDHVGCSGSIDTDIPVYVPAGSAELYRNAPGWDYFKNFIELDPFPTEAAAKDR